MKICKLISSHKHQDLVLLRVIFVTVHQSFPCLVCNVFPRKLFSRYSNIGCCLAFSQIFQKNSKDKQTFKLTWQDTMLKDSTVVIY